MPKDTKSSGNNKAPACESRGFGHKKEGENFDTPSFIPFPDINLISFIKQVVEPPDYYLHQKYLYWSPFHIAEYGRSLSGIPAPN